MPVAHGASLLHAAPLPEQTAPSRRESVVSNVVRGVQVWIVALPELDGVQR